MSDDRPAATPHQLSRLYRAPAGENSTTVDPGSAGLPRPAVDLHWRDPDPTSHWRTLPAKDNV